MFGQCWCEKGRHFLPRPRHWLQLIQWLWHCSFPYMAGYCPECASLHSTQFSCLRASPSKVEAESFYFKAKPGRSTHKDDGFPFFKWSFLGESHVMFRLPFGLQPLSQQFLRSPFGGVPHQDLSVYPEITGISPGAWGQMDERWDLISSGFNHLRFKCCHRWRLDEVGDTWRLCDELIWSSTESDNA